MKTQLPSDQQITGFQLTNVRKLSKDDTLGSDIPEEIIVAILTDHATKDPGMVIEQIIRKLQHTTGSKAALERAIQQLLVLSRLRNLEGETRKKVAEMPITYDITKDGLYKEGIERGIERGIKKGIEQGIERGIKTGIEQGIEKGIERGIEKEKVTVIKKALLKKKLNIEEIADLADVSIDFVLSIQSELDRGKNT